MIPTDGDFGKYDLVMAPVLYMVKEGVAEALEDYVKNGGTLVTSFMSGIVDESDNVHLGGYPGPLRSMAGVWVEEIDALAPEQHNTVVFDDGSEYTCHMLCDLMHLEGAESLAEYSSDFYAGMPAITRNQYGRGRVFYIGTNLEEKALDKVLDQVTAEANVSPVIDESTKLKLPIGNQIQKDVFYYKFC